MITATATQYTPKPVVNTKAEVRLAQHSQPAQGKARLTREQIAALQADMDAIRDHVMSELGERDAQHIRKIVRLERTLSVGGRALLMFGIDPISWMAGVAALGISKILENMEIGHNVLHGQYDFMNDPSLNSQTYEWDMVCTSDDWRVSHNYEHHVFTNIIGKDKDVGYGLIRVAADQPWEPKFIVQPVFYLLLASGFQWGIGVHEMDLADNLGNEQGRRKVWEGPNLRPFLAKVRKQLFKDYVFFPVIALWNAPRVFAGNFTANLLRNWWLNLIIFCGHFPEGAQTYTLEETEHETRGDWYLRQLQGSANIEGRRWFHIMSGHLSHQIEHHLFPDMPAHRYADVAPQVRTICEKYGIPYNSGGFWKQYSSVVKNLFRFALPNRENRESGVHA